jgi:hypothetical protein
MAFQMCYAGHRPSSAWLRPWEPVEVRLRLRERTLGALESSPPVPAGDKSAVRASTQTVKSNGVADRQTVPDDGGWRTVQPFDDEGGGWALHHDP